MPGGHGPGLLGTPSAADQWLVDHGSAPADAGLQEICAARMRSLREHVRGLLATTGAPSVAATAPAPAPAAPGPQPTEPLIQEAPTLKGRPPTWRAHDAAEEFPSCPESSRSVPHTLHAPHRTGHGWFFATAHFETHPESLQTPTARRVGSQELRKSARPSTSLSTSPAWV
ncbi:ABATE domain-containing protein [Streptomyces sp. TE5632]